MSDVIIIYKMNRHINVKIHAKLLISMVLNQVYVYLGNKNIQAYLE